MTTATKTATEYTRIYFEKLFADCYDVANLKSRYRETARKFHPDLFPDLGQEPMQNLNAVYEAKLKGFDGQTHQQYNSTTHEHTEETYRYDADYEKFVMHVIQFATSLKGVEVELVGKWVWIGGDTRAHAKWLQFPGEDKPDTRKVFYGLNGDVRFQWSKKQQRWYLDTREYNTGATTKKRRASGWSFDKVKAQHGSTRFATEV